MKFATFSKTLVAGLALFLASSAFAATKENLQLFNPTVVNGTQLKAGEYKLQWEGSGPNVEVSILQGKKVVTKTQAHLVDLTTPANNSAAVITKNSDGTSSLEGARFAGKKFALELAPATDSMSGGK